MHHLIKKLHQKGWSKKELDRAEKHFLIAQKNKSNSLVALDESVFWVVLLSSFIMSAFVSLAIVPAFLFLGGILLNLCIVILSFCFGMMFNFMVSDIHTLERKHHILILSLIPLFAFIHFLLIIFFLELGDTLSTTLAKGSLVSLFYIIPFFIPYLLHLQRTRTTGGN